MAKVLRGLVSKKKKRFSEDGFDLDLSYITPQLIAMGYPTEGRESAYRNPYKQVVQFLERRHAGHYKVYNLCSEKNRQYDPVKFNDSVACYPFEDHHPPPFDLIELFCKDVKAYLAEDEKNVAAIHCKAGKGRTGTMIICYLLYSHFYSDPDHAKRYYAAMRTYNRKGLTIPSQIRYVDYFYSSLKNRALVETVAPPTLVLMGFKIVPPPFVDKLELLRFTVHCNRSLVYEHKTGLTVDGGMVAAARTASQSRLEESGGGIEKLPKEMPCPACGAVHKAKLSVWFVCGLCGRDTCSKCTEKKPVGDAPRYVCGTCVKELDKAGATLADMETRVAERLNAVPEKTDESFALVFKPDKPIAVRGDVKVSVWHAGPKPLVHFWINTRFHTQFPIVMGKQQVDGSDKDLKHKRFPADFRIVADFRPAEAGESMVPVASDPRDKKRPATSVSGIELQPNGAVCFNKLFGVSSGGAAGKTSEPAVAASLLEAALRIVAAHAVESKGDGHVFSIDSAASVASDLDYGALLGRLSLLSAVDLSAASLEETIAFWLNTYHLLSIVSVVELFPYSPKDRVKNARNCSLFVCGEKLTLMQIEFGILRAAHALPALPTTLIGGNLPKRIAKLGAFLDRVDEPLQRLISFGISYACPGSPNLQVYSGPSLVESLTANGAAFVAQWGVVIKKSNLLLSAYLEWFQSEQDTSQSLAVSLEGWLNQVRAPLGAQGDELIRAAHTHKIKFEDNVLLDEIVFYFGAKKGDGAAADGLHFAALLSPRPAEKDKQDAA